MAWHYEPEQSVTEQDKRVYTKLHSAQPESSIGLGYQTAFLSIFRWGKRLVDYVAGTIGRRSYYSIRVDIGFKMGISLCTVRVVYIHATGCELFLVWLSPFYSRRTLKRMQGPARLAAVSINRDWLGEDGFILIVWR